MSAVFASPVASLNAGRALRCRDRPNGVTAHGECRSELARDRIAKRFAWIERLRSDGREQADSYSPGATVNLAVLAMDGLGHTVDGNLTLEVVSEAFASVRMAPLFASLAPSAQPFAQAPEAAGGAQ